MFKIAEILFNKKMKASISFYKRLTMFVRIFPDEFSKQLYQNKVNDQVLLIYQNKILHFSTLCFIFCEILQMSTVYAYFKPQWRLQTSIEV